MRRIALLTCICTASPLLLAACADAPTRPSAPRAVPDAGLAAATPLSFRQVSAGNQHTCGVTTDDVAYCWGENSFGQLGIGPVGDPEVCNGLFCSTRPLKVVGGLAFRQVSAGGSHSCAVTTQNVAYCWGYNGDGQLGNGSTSNGSPSPVRVVGGYAFRAVSAGDLRTCGVTTSNVVFCWGTGPLGDGTIISRARPVRVAAGVAFRKVQVGAGHTCAVTLRNVAWCWGGNDWGQVGDGTTRQRVRPVRVAGERAFRHLDAGFTHTCGATTGNAAYCWGDNTGGQLGVGNSTGPEKCRISSDLVACSKRPVRVVGGLNFRLVKGGGGQTCGVTLSSVAYCWGDNVFGELGNGTNTGPETCSGGNPCSTRPVRVVGGLALRGVSAGFFHTCGVTTSDVAYCWGYGEFGQLGNGTTGVVNPRPVPVAPPAR